MRASEQIILVGSYAVGGILAVPTTAIRQRDSSPILDRAGAYILVRA